MTVTCALWRRKGASTLSAVSLLSSTYVPILDPHKTTTTKSVALPIMLNFLLAFVASTVPSIASPWKHYPSTPDVPFTSCFAHPTEAAPEYWTKAGITDFCEKLSSFQLGRTGVGVPFYSGTYTFPKTDTINGTMYFNIWYAEPQGEMCNDEGPPTQAMAVPDCQSRYEYIIWGQADAANALGCGLQGGYYREYCFVYEMRPNPAEPNPTVSADIAVEILQIRLIEIKA
jgi:hypothetical protein